MIGDRPSLLRSLLRSVFVCSLGIGCSLAFGAEPDKVEPAKIDPAGIEFFENKVRPLLVDRCFECHSAGAKKLEGGLRLDSQSLAFKGGESGPAIVPGDLKKSLLIGAVNHGELYQMPPKKKLPPEEIAIFTKWVEMGAPWQPESTTATGDEKKDALLWEKRRSHWCWQAIQSTPPPKVTNATWAADDLDRFILSKLEAKGLAPAPPADKAIWLRRVTFDLIGLPPTPEEVEAFLKDESSQAVERVVDRLLASPHFGEHWARKWLDLVRYAETRGHEFEPPIPNAWQYRDYLIRAFNADVPYDQFVREHLAGDLLEHPRLHPKDGGNESVLGTGFWFLGEEVHSPVDIRQDETDRMDNRLDVMCKTFLGLTVGCARCHDHKFDPITQRDYYGMVGFLLGGSYRQAAFDSEYHNRQIAVELEKARTAARDPILAAWFKAYSPGIGSLKTYLLAAREAQNIFKSLPTSAEKAAEFVKEHPDINPEKLKVFLDELIVAKKEAGHPFHAFAIFEAAGNPPQKPPVEKNRGKRSSSADDKTIRCLADYTVDPARDQGVWYADGVAFGLRPVRRGEIYLSDKPGQPIAEFVTSASARRDPAFFKLEQAPGNERDSNAMGNWNQSGQTLRTPTFTLESGRLFYLVRGGGRCYASVDSHLVVSGPLHGRVVMEWGDGPPGEWRWVQHDLSPYKGHRCHLEFTPRSSNGPLEIAQVVDSEKQPTPPPKSNGAILSEIEDAQAFASAEKVAEITQKGFERISEKLRANQAEQLFQENGAVEVVDWAMKHPLVFSNPDAAAQKLAGEELEKTTRPFVESHTALVQKIRRTSRSAPAMFEGNGVNENVLRRGSPKLVAELVPRRFLEMLGGEAKSGYGTGSGRLVLAEQILADDNPFVSRVLVNRVWHHLFGRGIVPTVDNFGILGQSPTHPELLDFLAERFRHEQKWSIKDLIRRIVLSQSYRMSITADPKAAELDPDNLLWQHANLRRLPAEAVRDSILANSGRLDRTVLGSPVEVHLTSFMEGRGRPGGSGPLDGAGRRSIYIKVRRNFLSPMMLAFDAPIPFNTVGRRSTSNVPAQALILMNDPFVAEQARFWAKRAMTQTANDEERLTQMFLRAFARSPQPEEVAVAKSFLEDQTRRYMGGDAKPTPEVLLNVWADYAQALFNAKEFTFIR